jgi:hypothetical protein
MPEWRNGKTRCAQTAVSFGRAGSNPAPGTTTNFPCRRSQVVEGTCLQSRQRHVRAGSNPAVGSKATRRSLVRAHVGEPNQSRAARRSSSVLIRRRPMVRIHPREPDFHLGVAQLAARVIWDHEAAGSRPAAETSIFQCCVCLGVAVAQWLEQWVVVPRASVRLRPVTPKRMPPRGGIGRRAGLRNRCPQGVSVRPGPRGPTSQSGSSVVRAAPS